MLSKHVVERIPDLARYNMQSQKNHIMNNKLFDSMWQQIRSQTTGWWSLMSDYDLIKVDKATVKLNKYATMLQVKYGYTREQAVREIVRHVNEWKAKQRMAAGRRDPADMPETEEQRSNKELLENDSLGG